MDNLLLSTRSMETLCLHYLYIINGEIVPHFFAHYFYIIPHISCYIICIRLDYLHIMFTFGFHTVAHPPMVEHMKAILLY